jgi:hypothetical protein
MRKNLKITEEAHATIKKYCDENHLKISDWATSVLLKEISEKEDEGKTKKKLPNL